MNREELVMSQAPVHFSNPDCQLDPANGRLEGGKLLKEGKIFYAYAFERTDPGRLGQLAKANITLIDHVADPGSLPPAWGVEMWLMIQLLVCTYQVDAYNVWWCRGEHSGETVRGHWHLHFEPRLPGQPSSNMGPGLVIKKYDELAFSYNGLVDWIEQLVYDADRLGFTREDVLSAMRGMLEAKLRVPDGRTVS
jgi:diadenosine tetraphosphate (Ap4A) HIT family hydrolase